LSGTQLVCRLRAINRQMGFVLVTGYPDVRDAVRAIRDLGVIDYIPKPSETEEFLRCVDDAVANLNTLSRAILADLTICLESRCVWQAGQLLSLSSQEFELLAYLACRPGQVVSHAQLLDELWSCDRADLPMDMLWNVMKRLRAKLGDDPKSPHYIRTVRGIGYQAIDTTSE
jgi:DNA-binding response OmpR family regulator